MASFAGAVAASPPWLFPHKPNPLFPTSKTTLLFHPLRAPTVPCSSLKPLANPDSAQDPSDELERRRPSRLPMGGLIKALQTLQLPAETAAVIGVLTAANPGAALAYSGGSCGGSNFSDDSWSSSDDSYSSSSSYSSPSSTSSDDSSSYSNSDSPSSTYSSSSRSSSYDSNDDSSSSYYSCSVSEDPPTPITDEEMRQIGRNFLFLGCFLTILAGGFVTTRVGASFIKSKYQDYQSARQGIKKEQPSARPGITIHKIQVGVFGTVRTLQKDLNRIAETANTSTAKGFHYVLTETATAMLRQLDQCFSAHSSVDVKQNREDAEKHFKRLSIEERAKFDEQTLVNLNNIKRSKTSSQKQKTVNNKYIVVTILLAVAGKYELPVIKERADLKEVLQMLLSIPSNKTKGVEVHWAPQEENDTLTESDLHEDYPTLKPL